MSSTVEPQPQPSVPADGSVDSMVAWMVYCIGADETNGNNVNFITHWYGEDYEPWCNMTITYAAWHSGNKSNVCGGVKRDYTVDHAQWFANHGAWHTDTAGIQRGDIVFFDWNGSNSISAIDHVGIVEYVDSDGVHTIEGNIDNVCKRMVRHSDFIVGYGRPSYDNTSNPTPPPVDPPTSGNTYSVVSGDTMSGIAHKLGVTLAALIAANPQVTNPDEIEIGQVLIVPGTASTPPPADPPPVDPPTDPTPPPALPRVDLSNIVRAASSGYHAADFPADVTLVQNGLAKLGFISFTSRGVWGPSTRDGYAAFQRSLGYSGSDADGVPGATSLTRLGEKTGLFVETA